MDATAGVQAALDEGSATTYASWFAVLADPTRVQVLHAVATRPAGVPVGELAAAVGIAQATCSHHVRLLAEAGFVTAERVGRTTVVAVDESCCRGLPHAVDAVMGTLDTLPCCPEDVPGDVVVRAMAEADRSAVRRIHGEGVATRMATFDAATPDDLGATWLDGHRWVAELDGQVVGWTALAPTSTRACYAGVAETSTYVAEAARGRRVGVALLDRAVRAADADGLWTLQAAIFPENRASLRLHRSAGFRTVGVRERIGRMDGVWRDTVLLERRSPVVEVTHA